MIVLPNLCLAEQGNTTVTTEQPEVKETVKPFDFLEVETKAKELAGKAYVRDDGGMPESLVKLSYEQYKDIKYKADKTLWRDESLPFQLQAFHRGFIFKDRVNINIVDHGVSTSLAYNPELFDYGKNQFNSGLPPDLGFAGLRIQNPLRKDNNLDEIAVFLGASYFRAVGLGQVYGISARGLAVDTGLPKAEEFPIFREFWIVKPEKDSNSLTMYALLDSSSITGAYKFIIHPGLDTEIDVSSHLYARKQINRLGISPLTSMFFHGENTERYMNDYRPEVHDSDGLLLQRSTGEWVWRPLNNPRQLRISVFQDNNPKGFGLMTRDRNFDHYQDLDAQYQQRPSAWVETLGDWGQGAVYLIEIPSDAEKYDNIVSFWVPAQPIGEGKDLRYDYRLHFLMDEFTQPSAGKVLGTRIGGIDSAQGRRNFVVDFSGSSLKKYSAKAKIEAEIGTSSGKIENVNVRKIDENGSWRLSFDLEPSKDNEIVELRGVLKSGKDILTETWVYQWNAK